MLTGKTFCAKYSDVKLRPCPRAPNKEILLSKFMKIAEEQGWQSVGIDEKHIPDKRWLIDMISTYTPGDAIFKKDYMPPVRKNKLSEIKAIELPENFLKDLPASIRKSKRKGLRLAKDGFAGQRLARLKGIKRDIEHRILNEEEKKESAKDKRLPIKTITNEGTFKSPVKKNHHSNNSSKSHSSTMNMSMSNVQPQS